MPDLTLANNLLNVLCDSLNPGVGVDVTNNKKETQPEYTNNNNTTPDQDLARFKYDLSHLNITIPKYLKSENTR